MDYSPETLASWCGGRLAGKTAVVTGAGRGIGKGVALMFAAQGARTIACDIDAEALRRLAQDAAAAGMKVSTVAADLMSESGAKTLADAAAAPGDGVQILVNAAAVVAFAPIESMSFADWRRTLAGELDTVFLVTRAIWPLMTAAGGSIVNFSSANAHIALDGLPAIAHCAGKGGVLAMTRQMAMEGGPRGIRANSIAPGFTLTEETERHLGNEGMMKSVRAKLMIDRLGVPEDIAWLAVYVGSDESRFVTGADFSIDGGATAW
jgi:NAD(P)-dependent dehydrogenase (short-subunit alcohol dehydrogenase family)